MELLSAQAPTVAIAAVDLTGPDVSDGGAPETADTAPVRYTPNVVAAPFDPAVGAALAGVGTTPESPSYLDPSLDIALKHDSAVARRQDAVGSLLWRSLQPDAAPRTQILMPPLMWSLSPAGRAGGADRGRDKHPVRVGGAPPAGCGGHRGHRGDRLRAAAVGAARQPAGAVRRRRRVGHRRGDGPVVGSDRGAHHRRADRADGQQYTAPLREDLLRALSLSVPPDARNGLAQQRLTTVGRTVEDLFRAVTIVNPGGSYTLATERSPLPLALRNDLPVPIRVRLDIDAPPGMTVTDMGEIVLPPGFLPLKVPIEVHFTQRVAVDVALRTADGLPLGEPVRLSLHSNAYGKVLFFITLSAGAALVLLAGRRLWHRFRGQPDRADLDRPDPIEVALAYRDDDAADGDTEGPLEADAPDGIRRPR